MALMYILLLAGVGVIGWYHEDIYNWFNKDKGE